MDTEGITIEMNSTDTSQGVLSRSVNDFAEKETDVDDSSSESSEESETDNAEKNAGDIQDHYAVHDIVQNCCTFAGMDIIDYFDREKIKVGLRVVRGVDWDKENEDGGEGNVGTVVEILADSQQVLVQWDSQETVNAHRNPDKFIYRTGMDRKYDLRLFDNAQTGVFHKFIQCDGCDESPIRGMRWRCLHCEDYDLCTDCYMCDEHDLDHAFERIQGMKTKSVSVGMRADLKGYVVASGIFQDVNVKSRKDPQLKGTVSYIDDDIATVYNCDAKVVWDHEMSTKRYRIGREGKVDIKYITPGRMPYFQDHLQEINKANATEGVRVVLKTNKTEAVVGTIVLVKDMEKGTQGSRRGKRRQSYRHSASHLIERGSINRRQRRLSQVKSITGDLKDTEQCLIIVQWDNGKTSKDIETSSGGILLLDNSQIGIKQNAICDGCETKRRIKGVRWKCSQCPNYDLCTSCYMAGTDEHLDHIFQRINEPTKRTVLQTPRRSVSRKTALGIFKGAKVQEIGNETGVVGTVESICHYKTNNARCIVVVDSKKNENEEARGPYADFQIEEEYAYYCYYPPHLPDLGKDIQGYVKVRQEGRQAKIVVELWYQRENPSSLFGVQHSLYLVFAHVSEDTSKEQPHSDEHLFQPLEDVRKFAHKSRLPCQLAIERVLFFEEVVVIHKNTEYVIIQKLAKMGIKKFIRGDTVEDEDEQIYFQRMFQHLSGRVPLPACISMRNGVTHTDILRSVSVNKIPVISFKKNTKEVCILTMEEDHYYIKALEHQLDLKNPWKVIDVCTKDYDIGCYDQDGLEDEITKLEDISYDLEKVDALVCYLLIGVYMYQNPNGSSNAVFGNLTHTYPNALSMYLLKTGNWKIPRNVIKRSFSHRSIEFIYEEQMTEQFKEGLWKDLKPMTKSAYTVPKWKDDEPDSDDDEEDAVDGKRVGKLDIKISGLFGLIFFALLKKKYLDGAKQLIETGSVRIPHLLVGCVILQDIANDWQTSQIEKDKLLQMKMLCTQQALRITSCIHENDTRVYKKKYKERNDADSNAKELGKQIDHAGRLLLNHGYLSDAIKTENSVYLNDDIVKNVINQMWYKRESLSFQRGLTFTVLTVLHFLLLPILMITMEWKPTQRLYRLYKVPVMKVLLNMFGWLAILVAYSYMLLFDLTDGLSRTDWFIIAWMSSLFLDETKQIVIAIIRKKTKAYITDWCNYLEWGLMAVYLCGMLLKLGDGDSYRKAEKVLLVLTFILMCARFLNLLIISEIIGAKLVIIRKMFLDTFAFLMITTVITLCYSVSYYAILYSDNSDLSFTQIEKIIRNGFWILFGELSLENDRLKEPDCTFDKTIYNSGEMERCPSELGLFLAPYLKAAFALIAIILLLNLLIAMYSHTFEEVHEKSKFYWSQLQTDFLEEYSVKSIFPIHFQLLVLPVSLVHFVFWFPLSFVRKKIQKCLCRDDGDDSDIDSEDDTYFDDENDELNKGPMFVRVFLYDTNFDLNLKETRDAEGQAALKASGDLDVTDEDKITVLQRKMKRHKKITRSIDGRTSKIMSEIMQMKKNIRDLHQAISPNTMPEEYRGTDSRVFNDIWGIDTLRRQRVMDMLSGEDSFIDLSSSDDSEQYDTD